MSEWMVASDNGETNRRNELLADGWEPFSVVVNPGTSQWGSWTEIWFRMRAYHDCVEPPAAKPKATIPTPPPVPQRVVLGANGAYWRDFGDGFYSMCPNSTDNDPVEPVAVFVPEGPPAEQSSAEPNGCVRVHSGECSGSDDPSCACTETMRLAAQEPPAEGGDRG